ncbi:hypothetical protein ACROYT_G007127 [Oculina patagonica]
MQSQSNHSNRNQGPQGTHRRSSERNGTRVGLGITENPAALRRWMVAEL